MTVSELEKQVIKLQRQLAAVDSQLQSLRSRMLTSESTAICYPLAPRSPLAATQHRLMVQITGDNQNGTYQGKRKIALAGNVLDDDREHGDLITVANIAEISGYTGDLSVNDLACAYYDGLDATGNPIYQIWSKP